MRSRLPLSLLVAIVVLLGPACGDDGGRAPVALLASASTRTIDADSSRVALTIDVDDATASGGKRTIKGAGAFEFSTGHGTLEMDTAGLGLPGVQGKIQIVALGQDFYVRVPDGLLPGKPWLKVDLATLGQSAGVDVAGLQQLSSNDPSRSLRFVQGAQDAEERGEAKVRGVDTTQYHVTVNLEQAKTKAPADLHDDIDRLIEQLGRSTYPSDIWVDGDDLIRRVRSDFSGATGESAVVTQEFFDFGVDVEATAPPADQVSDFAQLLQGAGQTPG